MSRYAFVWHNEPWFEAQPTDAYAAACSGIRYGTVTTQTETILNAMTSGIDSRTVTLTVEHRGNFTRPKKPKQESKWYRRFEKQGTNR